MAETEKTPDEFRFPTERNPRLRLIIPMIVAVAFLMEQLDTTIITTAIPTMAVDLHTTVLRMNLAVTAYVLTLAMFIPVSGWLADRFGARRIFVAALLVFTASSILCGLATELPQLVAARCLQGLGGAMMTPVGRLILLRSFPRQHLVTAMLYMSLPALFGPVIGPLLGGILTSYASWRWIFFVNVPFGLVGCILALRFIEETPTKESVRFDVWGFIMVAAGLALLQLGLESLGHPVLPAIVAIVVLAAAGVLLLGFFRYSRSRTPSIIDLSLFRIRTFRIGTLAGGTCRIALNGTSFLLPLMLQVGMGMSPVQSGALTIRPASTRGLRLLGFRRVLVWSAVLSSALIGGFALAEADMPHWLIAGYIMLLGFVRSAQFLSSNTLAYADLSTDKLSGGTSLGGILQQLSVSLGVSLSALLLSLVKGTEEAPTLQDFHEAYLLVAFIPLLAVPGFLQLRPRDGVTVSGHQPRRPGNDDIAER